MLDVGRLCIKTAGREAGKVCCIVKKVDDNFVIITGPREITNVKRRRCNVLHLEPLKEKISISTGAQDSEIEALYEKGKILSKLNLKITIKKKIERPAKEGKVKKPEKKKKPEAKETPKKAEGKEEEKAREVKKEEPKKKPEVKKEAKEKLDKKKK